MRVAAFLRLFVVVSAVCAVLAAQARTQLDVQGHRGARGLMPENSIPAFKEALRLRVPTLELDIQVAKDHVLVVYHDPQLDTKRCVYDNGRRVLRKPIAELRYDELANIDCGRSANRRFPAQQTVPGSRIPRLEEVLTLVRDADYPVRASIEMKWQGRTDGFTVAAFAQRLVALVRQYDLRQRAIVQSFYPPALVAVSAVAPDVQRAILVRQPEAYERAVKESRATILSPRHDGLRQADVERFQRAGIPVIPWTVNKIADMCRLIGWGVYGLITDYPDRALDLSRTGRCGAGR